MSAELTRAAIRALEMGEKTQAAALAKCSEPTRERLIAEMGAIQWALAMCLVWHEQGVLEDVLTYIREACSAEAEVPAGV